MTPNDAHDLEALATKYRAAAGMAKRLGKRSAAVRFLKAARLIRMHRSNLATIEWLKSQ